jgi:hypothetical protein
VTSILPKHAGDLQLIAWPAATYNDTFVLPPLWLTATATQPRLRKRWWLANRLGPCRAAETAKEADAAHDQVAGWCSDDGVTRR